MPALARLVVEDDRREHVAVLGDRQRRHLQLDRLVEQLLDPARAVEQRVLGVQVQVDELSHVQIDAECRVPVATHRHSHSIVDGGFELMS